MHRDKKPTRARLPLDHRRRSDPEPRDADIQCVFPKCGGLELHCIEFCCFISTGVCLVNNCKISRPLREMLGLVRLAFIWSLCCFEASCSMISQFVPRLYVAVSKTQKLQFGSGSITELVLQRAASRPEQRCTPFQFSTTWGSMLQKFAQSRQEE